MCTKQQLGGGIDVENIDNLYTIDQALGLDHEQLVKTIVNM